MPPPHRRLPIVVLVLLFVIPVGSAKPATDEVALGAGDWFAFSLTSKLTQQRTEAKLVLVDEGQNHYDIGLAEANPSVAAVLTSALVPLGRVEKTTWAFDSLGELFEPWRPGREVGDEWSTRLHSITVTAKIERKDELSAEVVFVHKREDSELGRATIEKNPVFLRRLETSDYVFQIDDTGTGYGKPVSRITERHVALRFATDVGPLRSFGPFTSPALLVETSLPKVALHALVVPSTVGHSWLRVDAPDGSRYELSQSSPASRPLEEFWLNEKAQGVWMANRADAGVPVSSMIGVAFAESIVMPTMDRPSLIAAAVADPDPAGGLALVLGIALVGGLVVVSRLIRSRLIFLLPLFSRLERSDLLRNETRAKIVGLVRSHPAITTDEIRESMQLSRTPLQYHLNLLRRERLLQRHAFGRVVAWTVPEHAARIDARHLARTLPGSRQVLDAITAHPGIHISELARRVGLHHSTVSFHVRRLEALGAIRCDGRGRRSLLTPV